MDDTLPKVGLTSWIRNSRQYIGLPLLFEFELLAGLSLF
uniref:Uncharacterized protein n=1 Tax=Utricularia reniformis TaxID=192314 RepID=A0A1Y0B2D6_9LAMI|nr:hypothetical protein AEK19_MT1412 [Utricularia reniformis]ART31606.1 hypothetical protein AEK19_MT1412 [Utricularia reniformis]